eukprot:3290267-Amphidinium_carterae.1
MAIVPKKKKKNIYSRAARLWQVHCPYLACISLLTAHLRYRPKNKATDTEECPPRRMATMPPIATGAL